MEAEGAIRYRKLFDLHRSDIQLSDDDLQRIADATQAKSYKGTPENIRSVFRDIATFF